MVVPYQYVTEVFDLLEKAAAENDALVGEVASLKVQLVEARPTVKRASFSGELLKQAAETLVAEGLVPAGYDVVKTAADLQQSPDRILNLLIQLAAPSLPEGRPVKLAAPQPLSGAPPAEDLSVERASWLAALKPTA